MQRTHLLDPRATPQSDPPLSAEQMSALQQACAPVGLLSFPPTDIIRSLRMHGYIEIVLGGVQITPAGLERLLRERKRVRATDVGRTPLSGDGHAVGSNGREGHR